MKIIIVGGVAGGASAAARLRRLNEDAEITMYERGEYISFANCGLPYHIGGIINDREILLGQTPESFKRRNNVNVFVFHEVLSINRNEKSITVKNLKSGEIFLDKYDKLILSPGAEPIKPDLKGIDSDLIFYLRNIPDTDKINNIIENKAVKSAVIVGAGYIGIEMAENLADRGIKVSVVELLPQVFPILDPEMAIYLQHHLNQKGIIVKVNTSVVEFNSNTNSIISILNDRSSIESDMVIMSVGVRPENTLAKESGLKIGGKGGIKVNSYMQTDDPDIYAVGDAVEVIDFVSDTPAQIALAGPANKQGGIAADHICGKNSQYDGTQGTSICKVFDLTVATTGLSEKLLKKLDIPYIKSYTHSADHAGYYPGASPMVIKLLFSKTDGKILGSQIIGVKGVDKRIDVIATVVRMHGTIFDLENLELAYAPPYGNAKDAINIAGNTATNIFTGDVKAFYSEDLSKINLSEYVLLDVRTKAEYEMGYIPGSILIPIDELRGRLSEIPKDKKIIAYCAVGQRGYYAARILIQMGYDSYNLSGGFKTYCAFNYDKFPQFCSFQV